MRNFLSVRAGLAVAATVIATIGFAPPATALGSVLYVSQTGSDTGTCASPASPCATITYALTHAANGATINVSGTIHDNVNLGSHSGITVTGVNAPGGSPAVIDGSGAGSVFSTDVELNLDHLTVQNGHNTDSLGGGGVQASYSNVQLSNVTVTANSSDTNAGGVESTGTLTITNSTISGNTSNGGYGGGGIHVFAGSAQITNSTISGNHSAGDGGGIMIGAYHPSFFGNVTITGSTLFGNSSGASDRGGAINDSAYSTLTVNTSTITGNTAGFGAGIEVAPSASATVMSSTIAINKGSFGAGIDSTSGAVTIAGSIVAGNYFTDCDQSGGTWAVSYSLVSAGSCGTGTGVVNADPMLAPLADNGGPTKTLALSRVGRGHGARPIGLGMRVAPPPTGPGWRS